MAFPTQSLDLEASSSQYASIADASQTGLDITGDMTMEAWLKLESLPADTTYSVWGKWVDAGSQDAYLLQYRDVGGTRSFRFLNSDDGSSVGLASINYALTDGVWTHVAIVYTAATPQFELFIDGASQGTAGGSLKTSIANTTASYIVGQDNGSGFFDGRIGLHRVWNTARTGTQINDNKCTILGATTNLSAEWTFDNVYTDNSGNGNTLTPVNTPTFATDVTSTCAVADTGRRPTFSLLGVG